jgi:anti-sigma regulatory factor (Ser/Thr protein kinase)
MDSPVSTVAAEFAITRQAVQKHLQALVEEGKLEACGRAPHRRYSLAPLSKSTRAYRLTGEIAEDRVWKDLAVKTVEGLSATETDICVYGLTEIVNNAIEHSGGKHLTAALRRTAASIEITVRDDGIGVFQKISRALKLPDLRESALELSKGKLTTDPRRHTGEGIFFTSRVFDRFQMRSGHLSFTRVEAEQEWSVRTQRATAQGTLVEMGLLLPASRTLAEVFTRFSSGPDEYRFSKTQVPLHLAQLENEALISRSQARRVLSRVERFDEVLLDFSGVRTVGQAFADEIFRVFARAHPRVRLVPVHANEAVRAMIQRAMSHEP